MAKALTNQHSSLEERNELLMDLTKKIYASDLDENTQEKLSLLVNAYFQDCQDKHGRDAVDQFIYEAKNNGYM